MIGNDCMTELLGASHFPRPANRMNQVPQDAAVEKTTKKAERQISLHESYVIVWVEGQKL